MLATLSKNWWIYLVRGIASILFGLLALFMPGLTLMMLLAAFAAYAIVDGAATLFAAFASRGTDNRWWMGLLEGAIGVIAGLAAILWPDVAGFTLLMVIAAWAVLTGILQVAAAIRLRKEIDNEWWLALSGVISVLFGLYVLLFPGAGALALAWLIGLYAILFGAFFVALSLRLREQQGQMDRDRRATA
ncbi:MAG TPA: HdeD family acid-resistance protein [Spirillospora sp.]|nr:HdeD family acid-resistance protein [Spirillospora sp.]